MEESKTAQRRSCTHCGAGVPESQLPEDRSEPAFCCGGCEAVHRAIRSAGLEGYYDLQSSKTARPPPVDPGASAEAHRDFDTDSFLEEFAERGDDGTRSIELQVDGVHCGGCVWLVERMPSQLDGVFDARLNLARGRLEVRWNQETTPLSEVVAWLEQFGYDAHPAADSETGSDRAERRLLRKLGVSAALAANVMLLAFALYSGLEAGGRAGLYEAFRWTSFALATGAVAYGGSTFFRRAWSSLRPVFEAPTEFDLTRLSIDVPISIGILVGYLHSTVATFRGHGEIWFDSITVLIAALLAARWLQVRGQRLARDAADRLLDVVPRTARRVASGADTELEDAPRETVSTEELASGDVVEIRSGEVVPADGRVVSGASALELGVLTGESRPERVEVGDRVFAGATNGGSSLLVEVEAAGEESRVGELMEWIGQRGGASARVVRLADRLAGIFVLAVLAAAAATWAGWAVAGSPNAVHHAVALLVIACPCALGMATPLAMTIGAGRAARRGIYVKDDAVFERLDEVDELVIDKTGTVTEGSMRVMETGGAEEFLRRAAALESRSAHPIGRALERHLPEVDASAFEIAEVEETPGRGIRGRVDGVEVCVGRPDWVSDQTEADGAEFRDFLERATSEGRTPIAVGAGGRVRALAALGDPVRPRARAFVDRVRDAGIRVTMLSGDHPEVVDQVRSTLGLAADAAEGHVDPEQKRAYVRRRREGDGDDGGRTVAMVGDGVNDAAALEEADIGVAVGGAAVPSFSAADVFTTRRGMEPLFELLDGSQGVLATIRRNIGMSIVYNGIGISAAAAGLVTPLVAAIAMPLSSVAVVLSSVLQGSFDRSPQSPVREESAETTGDSTAAPALASPGR